MRASRSRLLAWAVSLLAQVELNSTCDFPINSPNCEGGNFWACCPEDSLYTEMQTRYSIFQDELLSQIARGYGVPTDVPIQIATPWFVADRLAIGLQVSRIFDIDQRSQVFKMKYTIRSAWRDCRTLHNCTYLMFDDHHPEFKSFWTPHFARPEVESDNPEMTGTRLSISPDGLVSFESDHVSTIGCKFDLDDFPFDQQQCTFTVFIPSFPWIKIVWDPTWGDAGVVHPSGSQQGEWAISGFQTEQVTLTEPTYLTGVGRDPPHSARLNVTFSRASGAQLRKYVIPTMFFWFSSWLGLFIDCAAVPARAALGIVPILTLANWMSSLTAALPPRQGTCVLERYMLYNLGLMALHLLEFALVNMALRMKRERKDESRDEESHEVVRQSSSMKKVVHARDMFIIRYLNRNLNVHTRWFSFLVFVVINALVLSGH